MYGFLEPIRIGRLRLKNRIIYSAMAKYMCDEVGNVTEQYLAYYKTIARGGCALVTPGAMIVDPTWPFRFVRQPWLNDDRFIPGLRRLTELVHAEDAYIAFQLWHPGESTIDKANKPKTINEFSLAEIRTIQDQFTEAAKRAKAAGADAIEFHVAHNYLGSQFMSPLFNKRTDAYGCSTVENAMRFSSECIGRIHDALGADFPVTAKINGSDFTPGGIEPAYAADAAAELEKAGVVLITVNGGGSLTRRTGMSADGNEPEGWKIPFAEAVKQKVRIPVAGNGSIRHPAYADACIASGKCDVIAIGRGLLAEPEWVNKVAQGREDELRYCVSCMHCFTKNPLGTSGCSVNPFAKREYEKPPLEKNGAGRKVAVVGAGPAGLEAAVVLAERGFAPVIHEAEERLGGMAALAAIPPGKQKVEWMLDYYDRQIERLNIAFAPGRRVEAEDLCKEDYYAVVLASGSSEFVPPLPGIASAHVVSVRKVLTDPSGIEGKRIVVIGGGLTGLETARMLALRDNRVTVLEMLEANPAEPFQNQLAAQYAVRDGVLLVYGCKVSRIEPDTVVAERNGEPATFPADLVVLSVGVRPNDALYRALKSRRERVYNIGDSDKPQSIVEAVQAGAAMGYAL
jgi:2,4-dienoyl-CoA reductase-like NADH-dependent reductase (Old Yellow Enzyme family)/thioredoxin reductase